MAYPRISESSFKPLFEAFEPRLMLDSQVGTVVMPFDGYLSAAIYDSNGQIVRTLLAREPELAGNVTLTWDGKDSLGRTVAQSGTYTWKALVSQVEAVDQGAVGDSAQRAGDPGADAGYFVQSVAVNIVGGTDGAIGGTFAKNDNENYYGDTTLSQTYTLNTPFSASGDFYVSDFVTLGNMEIQDRFFIGHFSSSTASNRAEFMGLEFVPGDANDRIGIQARFFYPNGGNPVSGALSSYMNVMANSGLVHFTYSYDPSYGSGRLTVHVYNDSRTIDSTMYADLSPGLRSAGASAGTTFDAFGLGTTTNEAWTGDDPTMTGKVFADNLSYSGNTGVVTFDTDPGWVGVGNKTGGDSYGWTSSPNADGSLYSTSYVEENPEIRKIGQDGSTGWASQDALNFGIAADEKYTYVTRHENDQDRLYRYSARDGASAGFGTYPDPSYLYIVLNSNAPDTKPANNMAFRYSIEEWRMLGSCWGIAADGYRVWVSNYRTNTLAVYNRDTGALLGQYTLTKPLGIAVDTSSADSGTVWVANNGDRLSKITFSGTSFTLVSSLTGLSDPTGVTIGGPSHHLFVAESGHSHIHEYDISGTPTLAGMQTFGSKATGGTLGDSQFDWTPWGDWASLAIDSTGILNVTDDHRIQRYYTVANPGAGIAAGDVYQSIFSEYVPSPVGTTDYGDNGTHILYSGRYAYEVDPEYTGGPRKGWMGDGSWRLTERYDFPRGYENGTPSLRRTINGHEMLYFITGATIIIYDITPTSQRMSAIVGVNWNGPDLMSNSIYNASGNGIGGRYNWTDTDGDGVVDWTGAQSGAAGEVTWNIPYGQFSGLTGYFAPWVDDAGNIWYLDVDATSRQHLIKVPLDGFDAAGNPLYDWAHRQTVITCNPNDGYGFVPFNIRIAANGDIWALGYCTSSGRIGTGDINGADWIARFDSAGNRQFLAPTLGMTYAGFNIDMAATGASQYYFTGTQVWVDMFTNDGLLVDEFTPGPASSGANGWMDNPYCIGAFTHPVTGNIYVYAEDSFYGKATRFRMDNMSTIQRTQGTFTYAASADPVVHLELDGNVNDVAGGHNGTIVGTPIYVTGHAGNAISLDGVDDYVNVPYAADFTGYTIAAWVKVNTVNNANIISRSDGSGYNASQEIRINNGKFDHMVNDGSLKHVTGTTSIVAGTWYYVAVTASSGGKARLYVNGVEQGTAWSIGSLWMGGDRFVVGQAAQGTTFFNGVVDDVRIYELALSQTDIQSLYNGTMKPRVNLKVLDTTASEQFADPGSFLISRDSSAGSLTAYYTLSGAATNGSDYSSLAGSVVFANGQTSALVAINPIDDAVADADEKVTLTLTGNAAYTLGSTTAGTVLIVDNDTMAVSPSSHWRLDDNLFDYNGHNEGKSSGGPAWVAPADYTDGLIGRDVTMDGQNDYLELPYATEPSAYTIAMWVKPTDATQVNIIFRVDGSASPTMVSEQIRINSSGKFEHYTNDGTGKTVTGTTVVQAGSWYHVAIVASNNGMARLYVNGVEEGTPVSIGTLWTGGDRFDAGRYLSFNGFGWFKGLMDDVQVFDVPLSGAQLKAIYAEENVLSLVATDRNASEPGTDTGTFTITRTITGGTLTAYYTQTGTATSGTDFSALSGSVVFANGQALATVTITPIDDAIADANETVTLTLSSNSSYTVGASASDTVTIADNEPFVTVTASIPTVSESGGVGRFVISRSTSTGSFTVYYACTGTATGGADYVAISGTVVMVNGQSSANVTVTPLDDGIAEGNETVVLTLSSRSTYNVGTPGSATVTITDNEPVVTVAVGDSTAAEQGPDSGSFMITRSTSDGDLVVYYSCTGTASSGLDYSALTDSALIANGQTSAIVTVAPLDDSLVEGNETVILTLSTNTAYNVGTPSNAMINIIDRPLALPGDATGNGVVDFNDYLVLESNFGKTGGATVATGDFTDDGNVDFSDYLVLEAHFGNVAADPVETASQTMLVAGQDSVTFESARMVVEGAYAATTQPLQQGAAPATDLLIAATIMPTATVSDMATTLPPQVRQDVLVFANQWDAANFQVQAAHRPFRQSFARRFQRLHEGLSANAMTSADALSQWEQLWRGAV